MDFVGRPKSGQAEATVRGDTGTGSIAFMLFGCEEFSGDCDGLFGLSLGDRGGMQRGSTDKISVTRVRLHTNGH